MKISDFNERIQAFYEEWIEEDDGNFKKILESGGRFWAKITPIFPPLNSTESQAGIQKNRYFVIIHKNHICNTRHAYLRQLRWNHKSLEVCTQWLEIKGVPYVKCQAKELNKEETNG